ncbi:MAG: ubiquinone/menaquinone biosynthesis methyltransferase [Acidimicrobiales bacterium]
MTATSLPAGREKSVRVRSMFDAIAPRYDRVNRIISLGLDGHWRRRAVRALALAPGSAVLDLGCGTGALGVIARQFGYRVVGIDVSPGMLAARSSRSAVALGDAAALPFATGSFDGVLCAYALRNFTHLDASLAEAARVVRPGGRVSLLEVATPPHRLVRAGHSLWFRHVVPVIGAALSDRDAYRWLPDSVAYLPEEGELRELLRRSGFATVGCQLLQGGLSQIVTGTRTGAPDGR